MVKYILIGGNSHSAEDGNKALFEELKKDVANRPIKLLDCLFARPKEIWKEKFKDDLDYFSKDKDFELELANPENFIEQIRNSDIVFFKGGTPKDLITILNTTGDWFKEMDGKTLVGSSGGADTICKYYGVGKKMSIGEGLGLLPIKMIPHWKSESDYGKDKNIDWHALLEQLEAYKEDLETITIKEGEFVVIKK